MSNLLNSVQIVSETIVLPTIKTNYCFTASYFFTGFTLLPSIKNWILFFIIPLFGVVQSKRIMEDQILTNEDVFVNSRQTSQYELELKAQKEGKEIFEVSNDEIKELLIKCLDFGVTMNELESIRDSFVGDPYNLHLHWRIDLNDFHKSVDYRKTDLVNKVISDLQYFKKEEVQNLFIEKVIQEIEKQKTENIFNGDQAKRNNSIKAIVNQLLEYKHAKSSQVVEPERKLTNPKFTLHRQCLAMYYLLKYSNVKLKVGVNDTDVARFIQLVTGRGNDSTEIRNTSTYKVYRKIFNKEDKRNYQDLVFIKPYFEKLGLSEIVKMIDNDMDINKKEKKK